jgi:hypothetical protein
LFEVFISQASKPQAMVYLQWFEWVPCLPVPLTERAYDLKQVASATGLQFPASACLERSLVLSQRAFRTFGWAQLVIDAKDVDAFEKRAARSAEIEFTKGFRMTRLTPGERAATGVAPPRWWRAEAVKDGIGGSTLLNLYGEVLIGPATKGHVRVYVQWVLNPTDP